MSDIKCVVCGEPWDSYGVNHGDMLAWETDLFRKGAGCPCCEGKRPAKAWEPASILDLENGDEDPGARIAAWEAVQAGTAPAWKEPDAEVLHTCDGCGVQLVRDLAQEHYDGNKRAKVFAWHMPPKARINRWWHSHSERNLGDPEEAATDHQWQPWKDAGREDKACPCCVRTCDRCDAKIAAVTELEPGDTYGAGASFTHEDEVLCINCFEIASSEEFEESCTDDGTDDEEDDSTSDEEE